MNKVAEAQLKAMRAKAKYEKLLEKQGKSAPAEKPKKRTATPKKKPNKKPKPQPQVKVLSKQEKIKKDWNITSWKVSKLNYFGITKCGNTSMKKLLISIEKPQLLKSMTDRIHKMYHSANILNNYIPKEEALTNGYVNFALTRNPYDRFLSMYKDQLKRPRTFWFEKKKTMEELIDHIASIPDTERNPHMRSQHFYVGDVKGIVLINVDNETAFNVFSKKYLNGKKLPVVNTTSGDYELPKKVKEKVYKVYRKDFDLGYKK